MTPLEYNQSRDYDRETIETIQHMIGRDPTGTWSEDDIAPLMDWQGSWGLTGDGKAGPATMRRLALDAGASAHSVALKRRWPDAQLVIDVSRHQGEIDWSMVRMFGEIEAVIVKVSGSDEGTLYRDSAARRNLEGAAAVGYPLGAYVYLELAVFERGMWLEQPIKRQIDNALEVINEIGVCLAAPLGLDFETIEVDRLENLRGRKAAADWIDQAIAYTRRRTGQPGMPYWSRRLWTELGLGAYLGSARAGETWWAYYPATIDLGRSTPVGHPDQGGRPASWSIWQFAADGKELDDGRLVNRGSVPGIRGAVDLNVVAPGALARIFPSA